MRDGSDLEPPPILYHYTTQDGLLGIIESSSIWGSKIQYLNDYQEFQLGLDSAAQVLKKFVSSAVITALLAHLEGIRQTNICVSSFSEAGDLLSQWRGYCAQGAGFSIGFDAQKLRELGRAQGFSLVRCEYDPDVSRKRIETYIKEEIKKNPDDDPNRTRSWHIAKRVATYSAGIKHISFAEEREWRLVSDMIHSPDPNFRFRRGQSVIVPYFKLKLAEASDKLPIRSVIVGPTPHTGLAIDSVSMLLTSKKVRGWAVTHSVIPYRNW